GYPSFRSGYYPRRGSRIRRASVQRGRGEGGPRGISDQHNGRAVARRQHRWLAGCEWSARVVEREIARGLSRARRLYRSMSPWSGPTILDNVPVIGIPRAILFDWDNTLVDSWATIHDALNFVMAAMDKPLWSLAETKEKVRLSLRESFPLHFGDRWEEARAIYLEKFRAIHLERLSPLQGREIMLRRLAEEGLYLGVVSNKTGAMLRREADHLGWTGFFGRVVGAGDCAADKPACDPVHLALD